MRIIVHRLLPALAALLLALPAAAAPAPEFFAPAGSTAPFSEAVRAGDLLFLSGHLGMKNGERALVPGGIQAETRATMEHIKAAVEQYGSSMDRVVKCTVFLADMAEWAAMNEVYTTYFPKARPARSAVGVNGLALGARVEIECIAALK
jgi:reactive intermediate/imine deaminase